MIDIKKLRERIAKHLGNEENAEAVALSEKLVKLEPNYKNYYDLGTYCEYLGNYKKAYKAFKQTLTFEETPRNLAACGNCKAILVIVFVTIQDLFLGIIIVTLAEII